MMRLELTTFSMARRRSSQLSYIRAGAIIASLVPGSRRCGRRLLRHGELRRDGAVDVAVDAVAADHVHNTVCAQDCEHLRLEASEAESDARNLEEVVDLGQLRRALRIDEVHALQIEHERLQPAGVRQAADPVLE